MRLTSPARRAAGLLAATTIGLSTAVLSVTGVASAAPIPAFVITATSTPGTAAVPDGYCAIDWTILGAQGGADFEQTAGGMGGDFRVRAEVQTGLMLNWVPGTVGGDAADATTPGAAGSGATGLGGEAGATGTGGGGGGGASAVTWGDEKLVAHGGTGAGADGGAGGNGTSNFASVSMGSSTDLPGANSGAGSVAGVGVPCSAPPAPDVQLTNTKVGADSITVRFFAPTTSDDGVPRRDADGMPYEDVSGYEMSVDGGAWTSTTPVRNANDPGDEALYATAGGLTVGVQHTVQLRATSTVGPGAVSAVVTATPPVVVPAPASASLEAGVQSLTFSWTAPADTSGLTGYSMEAYLQDDGRDWATIPENTPSVLTCEAPVGATSCTVAASPSFTYMGHVDAVFGQWSASTTTNVSGVIAAPAAAGATVPKSDGTLVIDAVDGKVVAGEKVTISGKDFLPGSTVDVIVYSTPVKLGSVVVLADGTFSYTATLPKDLANGTHHLVASGVDANGNPRNMVIEIVVSGGVATVTDSGGLAYTGFSPLPFVGAGVLALGVGGGLLVASRRRAQ